MSKSIVLFFNGALVVILGEGIITQQLLDSMNNFDRLFCGFCLIGFGAVGIWLSGLFQLMFLKKKTKNIENVK